MKTATSFHMMQLPPAGADGAAPAWIHILPAGTFKGVDGRGPYVVRDAGAVIAASMKAAHGKMPVDENHATDIAAKLGLPSPAQGWAVELQSRDDGIWARVDWNRSGREKMADRAYRGLSPVFDHDPDGTVTRIKRVALTNDPNLALHSLHHRQETRMDLAELARRLGLPETATQTDVDRALDAARLANSLHSRIGALVGLGADVGADALVTGVRARLEGESAHAAQVTALQAQVTALTAANAQRDAEVAVEQAARDGHVISDVLRTELVSLHTTNPEMARKIIAGLPKLPAGQIALHHRQTGTPTAGLPAGADAKAVAAMDAALGITDDDRKAMGGAHAY